MQQLFYLISIDVARKKQLLHYVLLIVKGKYNTIFFIIEAIY